MMDAYDWFTPKRPKLDAESGSYLPYTESPVWRFSAPSHSRQLSPMLFDVTTDPDQTQDLYGEDEADQRMQRVLKEALGTLGAPKSQYARLGFDEKNHL